MVQRIILLLALTVTIPLADPYTDYSSSFSGTDYAQALRMGLKFFGGQRCGDTHNWMLHDNPDAGNTCHLADRYNGHDVSGGWHDCGDHIKVATTMGYAATCLLVAYDVWPRAFADYYDAAYGPPNGTPDVLDEVKVATDFFIRSFPDANTFVYYIGNGDYDHKVWCTSSYQSTLPVDQGGDPRPSTASTTAGGPQAAGYAAALALMSIHYPDAAYRHQCLQAALRAWDYAKTRTQTISIPTYYPAPNTEYSDEYGLACMLLARATGDNSYVSQAHGYLRNKWESNSPLAWDTFADMTYYYLVLNDPDANNGSGGNFAEFLRKNVEDLAYASGATHPYGFPFFPSRWGTNKLACGSAFAAALYADLLGKGVIAGDGTKAGLFNRRVVDYVLGANEFGHTFLHGYQGDFHFKVHHRNAMGIDTNPPDATKENTPFLFAGGALIGGPKALNDFNNSVVDYQYTESGCDYNAPFVGAIAGLVAAMAPVAASQQTHVSPRRHTVGGTARLMLPFRRDAAAQTDASLFSLRGGRIDGTSGGGDQLRITTPLR